MAIPELFKLKSAPKQIITSRPIFQSSSSFINDDNDLKKFSYPLPLYHQRQAGHNEDITKPRPKPQSRLHLVLHILNIILTLTSLSLFITTIPIWNANFHHTHSLISGDYTDGLVLAPLIVSLLTSTYLLITEHTQLQLYLHPRFTTTTTTTSSSKPSNPPLLQPGPLILLTLTILLTLAPTLTLSATNSLSLIWRNASRTKSGLTICNLANIFSRQCQPVLYQIGGLQIGGIVMGGLAWCVWVVILVVAVRSWTRERRARKEAARERRKRRHERRRGHGHGYRHGSHGKKDSGHPTERRGVSRENSAGVNHSNKSQSSQRDQAHHGPTNITRAQEESYVIQQVPRPAASRAGDPAVRFASRQIRPKETIQVWLNGRNT